MKDLSDITPSDTDASRASAYPTDIDCGFPHDHDTPCGEMAPRRNRECSRERGHAGPHAHCGTWTCKYIVWTDDGDVVYDHRDALAAKKSEGGE